MAVGGRADHFALLFRPFERVGLLGLELAGAEFHHGLAREGTGGSLAKICKGRLDQSGGEFAILRRGDLSLDSARHRRGGLAVGERIDPLHHHVDLVGGVLRVRQHGNESPHVRRALDDPIDRDLHRAGLTLVFLRDLHQGRANKFLIDRVTVETIRLLHARKARIDVAEFAIGRSPRGTDERPHGELGLAALRGTIFGIAHLKTEVDRLARGEEVAFLRREEFHHRHRVTHRHGNDRFSGGTLVIAHDEFDTKIAGILHRHLCFFALGQDLIADAPFVGHAVAFVILRTGRGKG